MLCKGVEYIATSEDGETPSRLSSCSDTPHHIRTAASSVLRANHAPHAHSFYIHTCTLEQTPEQPH